jgi:hypothetical protein
LAQKPTLKVIDVLAFLGYRCIGTWQVHIKNLEVNPGVDRPLLSIQIILKAQTINEAEEKGEDCLLDYLRIRRGFGDVLKLFKYL